MKILTNYDFRRNQLMNALGHKLAVPPEEPEASQQYYDTVKNRPFYFNGTQWVGMDSIGATMTGGNIVDAINLSSSIIDDSNLSQNVNDAILKAHNSHAISDVTGLQTALNGKVDDSQVLTNVPANADFTNTITTINGKTGAISKADIVALGIPAQDTVYSHPAHTGDVTGSGTLAIVSNVVDNTKLSDMAVNTIKGRVTADVGDPEDLTAAQVRGIINVADGANNYSHPTGDGNLHVPITGTGSNGKVLKAGSTAGSLIWAADKDTVTTVNGKTGAISKADIVALGIPAQDTVYSLPVATSTVIGGVKSGGGVIIDASGIITVKDDGHNHIISNIDGLQTALDGKETPAGATSKASTAESNAKTYTDTKISELVGSAPATLDTLNELAAALGSDPNFATTITNLISLKTDKFTATIGDAVKTEFVLTHGLNTRDVVVQIRETAAPYAQVITDTEATTVNTATIKFAEPPASGEYRVTIIG